MMRANSERAGERTASNPALGSTLIRFSMLAFFAGGCGVAQRGRAVVFHERGELGDVYVVEEGGFRALRFGAVDGDDQSLVSIARPGSVPMEYVRVAAVALAHGEAPGRLLMIGLGGGTFGTLLWRALPALRIDAVEVDPVVEKAAREHFGLPDDPRYSVLIEDGADFARRAPAETYDMVFVDAYDATQVPPRLAAPEFFAGIARLLAREGTAVFNIAARDEEEAALVARIEEVFPGAACYRGPIDGNLIVVGAKAPAPVADEVLDRARRLDGQSSLPFSLVAQARTRTSCPTRREERSEGAR